MDSIKEARQIKKINNIARALSVWYGKLKQTQPFSVSCDPGTPRRIRWWRLCVHVNIWIYLRNCVSVVEHITGVCWQWASNPTGSSCGFPQSGKAGVIARQGTRRVCKLHDKKATHFHMTNVLRVVFCMYLMILHVA